MFTSTDGSSNSSSYCCTSPWSLRIITPPSDVIWISPQLCSLEVPGLYSKWSVSAGGQRKIQSLGEVVGSGEIPESWGRVGWEESGKLSHLYQASAAERPEVRAEQESDTGEEEDEGKLVWEAQLLWASRKFFWSSWGIRNKNRNKEKEKVEKGSKGALVTTDLLSP